MTIGNELFNFNGNLDGIEKSESGQDLKGTTMQGNRLLLLSGILCAALGAGAMFPAIVGWLARGELASQGSLVVGIGLAMALAGAGIGWGARRSAHDSLPPPVRAVMAANVLFLAFCALELTDGLLFRGGRVLYWTTHLFVPALTLLYGQTLAQRWAWWVARALAAASALWFMAFIAIIPFAHLQADGVSTPWYGRVYMEVVTLVLTAIAAYAFYSLGNAEARRYFGMAGEGSSAGAIGNTSATRRRAG